MLARKTFKIIILLLGLEII